MSNKGLKQASKGVINKGTIAVRIYLSSLRKIKRVFPAEREETMVSYFDRLSKYLETQTQWDGLAK